MIPKHLIITIDISYMSLLEAEALARSREWMDVFRAMRGKPASVALHLTECQP